ncbi:hypothetical protein [Clostridioides sp. ZZV14-6345]|uniref:hypothetical protein n=1 Tax=Clostridioides sp. ZZV14-6345 TaxID=2811496 RepID=UPI001D12BD6A
MNIIEYIRKESVNSVFAMGAFRNSWTVWSSLIMDELDMNDPSTIFNLGDKLSNIFRSTASGREQSDVSGGGYSWEGLVCWYLNLCLIGTRTVVIKPLKSLIPNPISNAITVTYDNFKSNTESDLIALTFPDDPKFVSDLSTLDNLVTNIPIFKRGGSVNYNDLIDYLTDTHFNSINICVIQCKTNWKDNAQIPMLWDMIYSGQSFARGISVGVNGYSISPQRFTYAFVTVPSNAGDKFKPTTTCVQRVRNLSGGNYWGFPTLPYVSKSIKEIITTNFLAGIDGGSVRDSIRANISNINTVYNYFNITL